MTSIKPTLPKGTRDFGPETMVKRNYILDTIKGVYRKFGFMPLETPGLENLSVLTGKYGDEGDQLLFRILNSGDYLRGVSAEDLDTGAGSVTNKISEKGLRYDLTVPLARYVAMNRNEVAFPFKRYQIQPVWRADRPQKGRYREFYQCDADTIGSESLVCDAELVLIILEVLDKLGITDFEIRVNHRDLLAGVAEFIEAPDAEKFYVILDKLDKIGADGVNEELVKAGMGDVTDKLGLVIAITGDNESRLKEIDNILLANKGVSDTREILKLISNAGADLSQVVFDPTLARGLAYYTGAILEIKVKNVKIGSIGGGGRYDNLTGVFGYENVAATGFSFGIDRIYDVMEELSLFPDNLKVTSSALVVVLEQESFPYAMKAVSMLRQENIGSEIYPEVVKLKKPMTYANRKSIPFVILIGEDERNSGKVSLKNMETGEQDMISLQEVINQLKASGNG